VWRWLCSIPKSRPSNSPSRLSTTTEPLLYHHQAEHHVLLAPLSAGSRDPADGPREPASMQPVADVPPGEHRRVPHPGVLQVETRR
jgi:hypothetical protein